MRLFFMLSVTVVALYFGACNATAAFDESKIKMIELPGIVHSTGEGQQVGANSRRFLRTHQENGVSSTEERGFNIAGLVKKWQAKKLAKELLNDPNKAQIAYREWQAAGKTLTDIDNFLKLADPKKNGAKYNQVYNGYMYHLDLLA
ncbi:Avr3a family secreted RxLR effector peptide protein [Phytophthora palmivora]|uniref:RxLR effector protein n=1 Tax=Phytophthora palmivora TaxID=4796 RepID=A0A2P4XR22_9STRA|nr:Avr3a family secreted RxLR effector peptide protein [Phytophthora palmivora]